MTPSTPGVSQCTHLPIRMDGAHKNRVPKEPPSYFSASADAGSPSFTENA